MKKVMISTVQVSEKRKKHSLANNFLLIDCYRKKQRGDCGGIDFQRAAKERAQYIHNLRHPDQPPPTYNPRPPVRRDFSRNPSWTLRQLERDFLSYQEPNKKDPKVCRI